MPLLTRSRKKCALKVFVFEVTRRSPIADEISQSTFLVFVIHREACFEHKTHSGSGWVESPFQQHDASAGGAINSSCKKDENPLEPSAKFFAHVENIAFLGGGRCPYCVSITAHAASELFLPQRRQ